MVLLATVFKISLYFRQRYNAINTEWLYFGNIVSSMSKFNKGITIWSFPSTYLLQKSVSHFSLHILQDRFLLIPCVMAGFDKQVIFNRAHFRPGGPWRKEDSFSQFFYYAYSYHICPSPITHVEFTDMCTHIYKNSFSLNKEKGSEIQEHKEIMAILSPGEIPQDTFYEHRLGTRFANDSTVNLG